MMGTGTNKWHQNLISVWGLFHARNINQIFIATKQIAYNRPWKI